MSTRRSPPARTPFEAWPLELVIPPLALLGPLVAFLKYNDYSLITAEVALFAVATIGIGLVMGAIAWCCGRTGLVVLVAAMVWAIVDFQSPSAGFGRLFTTAVCALVVSYLLREHLRVIATVVFATILVFAVVLPVGSAKQWESAEQTAAANGADLPTVVHLVLDGHIGIEGVPSEIEGGRDLADEIRDRYVHFGFRVLGSAYSSYWLTTDSIPNLLNFATDQTMSRYVDGAHEPYLLRENGYFAAMNDAGYRIHVIQSDYLDYCSTDGIPVASCKTYSSSGLAALRDSDGEVGERARVIAAMFLNSSSTYRLIRAWYNALYLDGPEWFGSVFPGWYWDAQQAGGMSSAAVVEQLIELTESGETGELYYAHLMSPHYPYVHTADCGFKPMGEWSRKTLALRPNHSREQRYRDYFDELRCLGGLAGRLLESMDSAGVLEDAIVIVHGDHGSRLSAVEPRIHNRDEMDDRDYLDAFSTLFALKMPGVAGGYTREPVGLGSAFLDAVERLPGVPSSERGRPLSSDVHLLPVGWEGQLLSVPMRGLHGTAADR